MKMISGDDVKSELSLGLSVLKVMQNGLYFYINMFIAKL